MAARGSGLDGRSLRNGLPNWRLQRDHKRLVQEQERPERMTAPKRTSPPAPSPVEVEAADAKSSRRQTAPNPSQGQEQDRLLPVRRARVVATQHQEDPEEEALMNMIMDREQSEAATSNQQQQHDHSLQQGGRASSTSSRIPHPAVLPPLRRPLQQARPPNNEVVSGGYRPTSRKLNTAGDFYSPVRPRDSNTSGLSFQPARPAIAPSGSKTPIASTQLRGKAAPSTRSGNKYDQMKTPDRWRRTAMRSNQAEIDASSTRRWEEEDAAQADRLLEKAARDGDHEALWNDLFFGTKAARARVNHQQQQEQEHLEQPVLYSTSSFPEVLSRSRSNSHGSSCYEDGEEALKVPQEVNGGDEESPPTERSKQQTTQRRGEGARAMDANGITQTKTISHIYAAATGRSETRESNEDNGSGGEQGCGGSNGGDKEQSFVKTSGGEYRPVHTETPLSSVFPRWGMIVLASCLVVGTSGFFVEELMDLLGLFSKSAPFTLSRAEQERMRDRLNGLQQELQGFRLAASDIDEHSQKVFEEVRRHLDKMRSDRAKHQDVIAKEMHELRRYILRMTYEMVEQEREVIHARLKETVGIHVAEESSSTRDTAPPRETDSPEQIAEGSEQEQGIIQSPVPSKIEEVVEIPASDEEDTNFSERLVVLHQTQDNVDQQVQEQEVLALKPVIETRASEGDVFIGSAPEVIATSDSSRSRGTMFMSWELMMLMLAVAFLGGCVALRVRNMNRRKQWFEERRKRRHQRALLLAQQRAMAEEEVQDEVDEWESAETDSGVETVALMTPIRDDEGQEEKSEQGPPLDEAWDDEYHSQSNTSSPGAKPQAYRMATSEVSQSPWICDHIKGREVLEEFGMVSAVAVRSKSVVSDMYVALAGLIGARKVTNISLVPSPLRHIWAGEAASYTSLMNETVAEAVHRVQFAAKEQGATAVINVRFDSNTTMNRLVFGMHCSVICYGTAVRCRQLRELPPTTSPFVSTESKQ
ncbi:hypothetical protein BBJ28_00016909 [Nothophytophthora sp. Chile5]|nr:hypothetical protein BBJ28_00016909 [Nothophytophthora sp. Chile5]